MRDSRNRDLAVWNQVVQVEMARTIHFDHGRLAFALEIARARTARGHRERLGIQGRGRFDWPGSALSVLASRTGLRSFAWLHRELQLDVLRRHSSLQMTGTGELGQEGRGRLDRKLSLRCSLRSSVHSFNKNSGRVKWLAP